MQQARHTRNEPFMYEASQTDLKQRLQQVEGALEQCQRMALASRFAGAVMHEVNNSLLLVLEPYISPFVKGYKREKL